MADGFFEFRWFGDSRFQRATEENVAITFSDTMTLGVHSGIDKSHLEPHYERYSRSSAPPRSVRHEIKWFCARINIFDMQFLIQNESTECNRRYDLSLNHFSLSSA
jgi:hypothetical protein